MVEEAEPSIGVAEFDYLFPAQTLTVGGSRLVLSYLSNCRRETIDGGSVTIGLTESVVVGGSIAIEVPPCGMAQPVIMADARAAGAAVKRHEGRRVVAPASQITRTARPAFQWDGGDMRVAIYDVSGLEPLLLWSAAAVDSGLTYPAKAPALVPGRFYSVRIAGPGGIRSADFNIDPTLDPGHGTTIVTLP
ncbi:hypothetical protein [Caenispirillum bisanense]|uniref:hypothetical protein n=1 Tax=Caenispirillum bisanense TaxID=414052 RepID=UPI0031E07111